MKKAKLIATICSFATIAATTTICVVSCSNNSIIRKNLAKTEYNVSIFANEGGIVTVTVNGEEKTAKSFEEKLAFGTNLKVSAFPFAGYKFNKWSDSDTEVASTRNITIDSDKDIIVSFTKVTEEKNLQTPAKHAFNKMIYDEKTYELANDIDPNVFCFKSETISIPQLNGEEDIKINIEESSKLTAVDLKSCDSSVISIDDNFLSDCTGLKSVNLNGLSKILIVGYDFMRNCEELKTLDLTCLRDSVKIESHFLSGCKSLTDLTLPNMDITLEKVKSDGKLPLSIQKNNFMDNAPEDCKVHINMKGKKYVFPLNEVSYFLPTTPQKPNAPHKVSISAYKNGEIQITANGNTKTIDNTEPFIEDVSGMIRMSVTPAQGFKFKKWSDGNTESARYIYATKNWTLFAIFEETEKFNVSVQTTEGGIVDVTVDGNKTVVDSNNLYNAPSYVGTKILVEAKADETNNYVFDHWNDDLNDTNPKKEFASLFENVDLTAYFVLKHTLKLEKPEHGWYEIDGKKVTNEFNVTFNDRTPITVKAIAENGYVFSKWSDDVTDSQRTISKDMQLTAYFVEKSTIQNVGQHALTINATDGGIVEVTVNGSTTAIDSKHKFGATLPKETQITIKVNPVDGYKFIGWNNESLVSGNEEEGFALTTKDEDVNLIALFGKKGLETIKTEEKAEQTQNQDCILELNADTGGEIKIIRKRGDKLVKNFRNSYEHGTQIQIEAVADKNYKFSHWSDNNKDINRTITVDGYKNITAYFTLCPNNISINSSEGGKVKIVTSTLKNVDLPNEPFENYSLNNVSSAGTITIEAIPEDNYIFIGWSDSDIVSLTRTISTEKGIDLVANFKPKADVSNTMNYNDQTYALPENCDPNLLCFRNNNKTIQLFGDKSITIDRTKIKSIELKSCDQFYTNIDDNFLNGCANIKNVHLSGLCNIASIGDHFLSGCESLEKVDLTSATKTTTIGNYFLFNCGELSEINMWGLNKMKKVGSYFLAECINLNLLKFPGMGMGYLDALAIGMGSKKLPADIAKTGFMHNVPSNTPIEIEGISVYTPDAGQFKSFLGIKE